MFNISQNLDNYILNHIDEENEVLWELNRQTHIQMLRPRMLSGHLQGQILKMLCQMIRPSRILELGTFTGYSAISMAMGMPAHGHIDTIEINDEFEPFITGFFEKAGFANRITLHIGNAAEIIQTLPHQYDLVFMDADKRQYPAYYERIFDKLSPGGYILADNILWDGKIIEPLDPNDDYTKGILEFNKMVKEDQRVDKVILPIRDGLFLIRKKD